MLFGGRMYSGCQGHIRSRYSGRLERRPGLRERHSLQKERHGPDPQRIISTSKAKSDIMPDHMQRTGSYATPRSNPVKIRVTEEIIQEKHATPVNEEHLATHYQECSTIEEIRREMKSRPLSPDQKKLPDWLVNLDLNLDATALDIIPPFDDSGRDADLTYTARPTVTIVYDEDFEGFSMDKDKRSKSLDDVTLADYDETATRMTSPDLGGRISTRTYRKAKKSSPRRYQGDKKVMSMQTGGIRSTPMQPKSKKFINQMITYNHMKHHDRKLRVAKPAIDTKMPATFRIALDRKRLVEERLSGSWNASYDTTLSTQPISPSQSTTLSSRLQQGSPSQSRSQRSPPPQHQQVLSPRRQAQRGSPHHQPGSSTRARDRSSSPTTVSKSQIQTGTLTKSPAAHAPHIGKSSTPKPNQRHATTPTKSLKSPSHSRSSLVYAN